MSCIFQTIGGITLNQKGTGMNEDIKYIIMFPRMHGTFMDLEVAKCHFPMGNLIKSTSLIAVASLKSAFIIIYE